MRTWILVVVLALAACGKDKAAGGPPVEPGAPAGDVLEVIGVVTAKRGDEMMRQLNQGDVVAGDDVIGTAEGASVVIQLRHNGVRWSLKGGHDKRLGDSAAWKAPAKGDSADGLGERATAAGRHAEREAADTAAGAPKMAAPSVESIETVETTTAPSPGAPPVTAPMALLPELLTEVGTEGGLSKDQASAVLAATRDGVTRCFAGAGAVTGTIKVDADGTVGHVEVAPDNACVLELLRGLTFPPSASPSKIHVELKLGG